MVAVPMRSLSVGLFLVGFSIGGTQAAFAYELKHTFLNPTANERDFFGVSVAGVGNNLLIGSFQDDAEATDAGRAYLFDGNPTSPTFGDLLMTFQSPNPSPSGNFGGSVASVGKNVLIGESFRFASFSEGKPGAAYLFNGDPTSANFGQLLMTFQAPIPSFFDMVGFSVDSVGDNVLVGAFNYDAGANNAGVAFLFDGDPTSTSFGDLLMTFDNPNPAPQDLFGVAVAGVGKNVLIGAFRDDTSTVDSGAAYLFDGDPTSPTFGQLLTILENPNPSATNTLGQNDEFGHSVASVGKNCLIGAFRDDTGAFDTGSAYLYDCDPVSPTFGNLLATLNNPSPYSYENFGFSLAGIGNYALVGSWREHIGAYFAGAVYVYDANPNSPTLGQLVGGFLSPNPTVYGSFGTSVAVAGANVLIGAIGENQEAGSAYVYGLNSMLSSSSSLMLASQIANLSNTSTSKLLLSSPTSTPVPEPATAFGFFVLSAGGLLFNRQVTRNR